MSWTGKGADGPEPSAPGVIPVEPFREVEAKRRAKGGREDEYAKQEKGKACIRVLQAMEWSGAAVQKPPLAPGSVCQNEEVRESERTGSKRPLRVAPGGWRFPPVDGRKQADSKKEK